MHGHGTHKATGRLETITGVGISAPFLDVSQRRMAVPYPYLRVKHPNALSLKMGRIAFPRNFGTELPFCAA